MQHKSSGLLQSPAMARIGWFGKWAMKRMSRFNVFLYRVSGGRLGGKFPSGAPILLLTTIGRKSGKPRTLPLLYLEDGEQLVIVASKGGHDHHPLWYLNLVANPEVKVQVGKQHREMRAETASEPDRERLWPQLVEMYKGYGKYEKRTDRNIPVVVLSSADAPA